MNATDRARVIIVLKILAVLTFLASPICYIVSGGELTAIPFIVSLIAGAFAAAVCLAGIIIIEAAHWYLCDKERELGVED